MVSVKQAAAQETALLSVPLSVRPQGRFAPSPTGPLHFGSLIAALGSFLEARCRGGSWRVRIEDIDTPRTVPGAAAAILHTLTRYGLHWDGEVLYQSRRLEVYTAALARLTALGMVYPCTCSRRELAAAAVFGPAGLIYPGFCRAGLRHPERPAAQRLAVNAQTLCFQDAVQGVQCQALATHCGDFVLHRADGLFAYQLAVVVDDAAQGITQIVRGSDLLDVTPRQLYLYRLLGYRQPQYAHLPIAVDTHGNKLSKQTGAAALDPDRPGPALVAALALLGQQPPPGLERATVADIMSWALAHWRLERVPRQRAQVITN